LKGHFARNTTQYLFPKYFQSLRAKKIKTNKVRKIEEIDARTKNKVKVRTGRERW
jgi:hypothetical protein